MTIFEWCQFALAHWLRLSLAAVLPMLATCAFQQVPRAQLQQPRTVRIVIEFSSPELAAALVTAAPYQFELPVSVRTAGPFVEFTITHWTAGTPQDLLLRWATKHVDHHNARTADRKEQLRRKLAAPVNRALPRAQHGIYRLTLLQELDRLDTERPAWLALLRVDPPLLSPSSIGAWHLVVLTGLFGGFVLGWLPLILTTWWRREEALRARAAAKAPEGAGRERMAVPRHNSPRGEDPP